MLIKASRTLKGAIFIILYSFLIALFVRESLSSAYTIDISSGTRKDYVINIPDGLSISTERDVANLLENRLGKKLSALTKLSKKEQLDILIPSLAVGKGELLPHLQDFLYFKSSADDQLMAEIEKGLKAISSDLYIENTIGTESLKPRRESNVWRAMLFGMLGLVIALVSHIQSSDFRQVQLQLIAGSSHRTMVKLIFERYLRYGLRMISIASVFYLILWSISLSEKGGMRLNELLIGLLGIILITLSASFTAGTWERSKLNKLT